MSISRVDHFTLRTRQGEATACFFRDVIGLQDGYRPPFNFPGTWLYTEGKPIVHIIDVTDDDNSGLREYLGETEAGQGSGAVDHIALRCEDLEHYEGKFARLDVPFEKRIVPDLGLIQLFIKDPNGVTIEMVFDHAA